MKEIGRNCLKKAIIGKGSRGRRCYTIGRKEDLLPKAGVISVILDFCRGRCLAGDGQGRSLKRGERLCLTW